MSPRGRNWARSAAAALMMVALFLVAPAVRAQGSNVEENVRTAFTNLKHALEARDGAAIASYIDDETVAFYEKIRRAALTMPKAQLLQESLFFQIAVLSVRHYFKREDIEKIDGPALYAKLAAIDDSGNINVFRSLTIKQVRPAPDGQSAVADLSVAGSADTSIGVKFFLQRGRWKIYVMQILKTAADELQAHIGITPRTPPSVVETVVERDAFAVLAQQSGKEVTRAIWTPLAQAK